MKTRRVNAHRQLQGGRCAVAALPGAGRQLSAAGTTEPAGARRLDGDVLFMLA